MRMMNPYMTLYQAYLVAGGSLTALGALLLFVGEKISPALLAIPRSRAAAWVLWGAAFVWFIYHLMTIPNVDLAGFPRSWLIVLFGGAGLLAFKYLPDLLSLRGLAVLILFASNEFLGAGFGQLPYSRVLAGTSYLLIIGALWAGASPYVLRNAIEWTTRSLRNLRLVGTGAVLLGCANLFAGLFWLP